MNMKNALFNTELLLKFSANVGGVFSLAELSSLFNISSKQALWSAVRQFEKANLLKRYCRQIYIAKNFDAQVLSAKIRNDSYISLGSALAHHRLIGTESPFNVSCVVPSTASNFTGTINISYFKISEDLFFGFDALANGAKIADAEKAVLDTLYFYLRAKKFFFNIFQDIDFSLLSKTKFKDYLYKFKNSKFQKFAWNVVYGKL